SSGAHRPPRAPPPRALRGLPCRPEPHGTGSCADSSTDERSVVSPWCIRGRHGCPAARPRTRLRTPICHRKEHTMSDHDDPTPDALLQLGLAFWGSKALLTAVHLGLFTALAEHP